MQSVSLNGITLGSGHFQVHEVVLKLFDTAQTQRVKPIPGAAVPDPQPTDKPTTAQIALDEDDWPPPGEAASHLIGRWGTFGCQTPPLELEFAGHRQGAEFRALGSAEPVFGHRHGPGR